MWQNHDYNHRSQLHVLLEDDKAVAMLTRAQHASTTFLFYLFKTKN
jgi:hypothetical protein